jgi:hypothetical protein
LLHLFGQSGKIRLPGKIRSLGTGGIESGFLPAIVEETRKAANALFTLQMILQFYANNISVDRPN